MSPELLIYKNGTEFTLVFPFSWHAFWARRDPVTIKNSESF